MPRPAPRFHDFIGQKGTIDYLRRLVEGAMARGEPFPHTLLLGPSGVGKTRLAQAVAREFGTRLVEALGYEDRPALVEKLAGLSKGDFFFVDECHRLRGLEQELLCEAIDRDSVARTDRRKADTAGPEGGRIELKPWSLVLATDQPGLLLDALTKRVAVNVYLPLYPIAELKAIVEAMASELNVLLSPQAARKIAATAAGLPRRARHLLANLRLFHPDAEDRQLGLEQVREFLEASDIRSGLGATERRYLETVIDLGGASLESIALGLGTDADYVRREVEAGLIRRHLVKITPAGRRATPKGSRLVEELEDPAGPARGQKGGRS